MRSSQLNELSLTEATQLIQSGAMLPRDLVTDCIAQIEAADDELGAFTTFDAARMFDQLKAIERWPHKPPLYGIPVGIKDIMETAAMRTTMGSRIYQDLIPPRDAACVALLRAAGAIIAGKTETTEFAYFAPGKTRNPHAMNHTPGGSSMGSAAAVSQLMVPLALGTQTAGSVIRPAAYCGVVGYKASYGAMSLAGVFGFAQSLDTIGFFVREVNDLAVVRHALLGTPKKSPIIPDVIRVGFVKTPHWSLVEPNQLQLMVEVRNYLEGHDFEISEIEVEPENQALTQAQITIMAYEGCRSLSFEYSLHPNLLSDQIKELIERGRDTSFEDYRQALELTAIWQRKVQETFHQYDVLLTPSAPGEAPEGLDGTGDPIFNRTWTLLKVPCIHLPVASGANGLPLGVQLIGPFNRDDQLISIARRMQEVLAGFSFEANSAGGAN